MWRHLSGALFSRSGITAVSPAEIMYGLAVLRRLTRGCEFGNLANVSVARVVAAGRAVHSAVRPTRGRGPPVGVVGSQAPDPGASQAFMQACSAAHPRGTGPPRPGESSGAW